MKHILVTGTFQLLEAALIHVRKFPDTAFRFVHVSTDEVYGSLGGDDPAFTEATAYDPSSPWLTGNGSEHIMNHCHKRGCI